MSVNAFKELMRLVMAALTYCPQGIGNTLSTIVNNIII